MPAPRFASLVSVGAACALGLVLCGCTAGGQFDPTELLSTDIFNTKKTIPGEREPLFPNGVPGAETGVPADLIKGYQPPPEQAAAQNADTAVKPAAAPAKPKPKPKPVVAHAAPPPPPHDPAWDQKAASPAPAHDPVWDQKAASPPPTGQSPWPAPPSASPAQTNWPAPPPTGPAPQAAQPSQPSQPNWPNPPASSSH